MHQLNGQDTSRTWGPLSVSFAGRQRPCRVNPAQNPPLLLRRRAAPKTQRKEKERKMSAASLLFRSRVSARTISMALRPSKKAIQFEISQSTSSSCSQISSPRRRISCISRSATCSSCLVSMLPLHSAIASARLRSVLSAESQSWGMIPQGISMPL
ncbi:uncharacterized protein LOC103696072 [Phoenix dactylifera]|uniref:Uncharacterized protein LOC103696072 n=1 Tax=Phoenix dactylifera TaxID=42345 RepID=A0A8B9AGU7_PHODC|nr:uncharacterized protein LOC103696072 [Phoenix dactylifera]